MSNGRYGLMGPAILITVGIIFLIHEFRPEFHAGRLWPVILIVIGVIRILEWTGSSSGPSEPGGTTVGPASPGSGGPTGSPVSS
jgi:hypothetical protein